MKKHNYIAVLFFLFCSHWGIAQKTILTTDFIYDGDNYPVTIERNNDDYYKVIVQQSDTSLTENFSIKPFRRQSFMNGITKIIDQWLDNKTEVDLRKDTEFLKEVDQLFIETIASILEGDESAATAGWLTVHKIIPLYAFDCNGAKTRLHQEASKVDSIERFSVEKKTIKKLRKKISNNDKEILKLDSDIILEKGETDTLTKKRNSLITLNKTYKSRLDNIITTVPDTCDDIMWMKVSSVKIEFYEGHIENIGVLGYISTDSSSFNQTQEVLFENNYPIAYSSKTDITGHKNTYLFETRFHNLKYKLNLGDLLEYEYNIDSESKDYSPKNDALKLIPPIAKKELYKESFTRLLQINVFSDFIGVDEDQPNGLIQTEVSKRLNLKTGKKSLLARFNKQSNWSSFTYILPELTISKVESNNRRLLLSSIDENINGQLVRIKYLPILDIKQFQHFTIGADLNLLHIDVPNWKSKIEINAGFRFGRTALKDSTKMLDSTGDIILTGDEENDFGINTLEVYPKASLIVKPSKNFGLTLSGKWTFLRAGTREVTLIEVEDVSTFHETRETGQNGWFNTYEIKIYRNTSAQGNLFLRYRFHHMSKFDWPLTNFDNNYHQIQVGYSTFFTKKSSYR